MRTQAIIIRRQPTNEYDLLLTLYTQELGKLTAIAKSALKPSSTQGPHLDTYNLIDVELVDGKTWPIVTGAQCVDGRRYIKSSLYALAQAGFFAEAVSKIVFDGDRDPALWEFLCRVHDTLNEPAGCSPVQFAMLQAEFVKILGHGGESQSVPAALERIASARLAAGSLLMSIRAVLQ